MAAPSSSPEPAPAPDLPAPGLPPQHDEGRLESPHDNGSPGRAPPSLDTAALSQLRHQINNPLAVIMGQAQLLELSAAASADPAVRVAADRIIDAVGRIVDVLRALPHGDHGPALAPRPNPDRGPSAPAATAPDPDS